MDETAILKYVDPGTGYTIFSAGAWLVAFLLGILGTFSFFFKRSFGFFKNHKKIIIIVILMLVATGLIIKGAFMSEKISSFNKKVIILGFDALSPEIIEPMMKEGKLPNFSRLKAQGCYRHLSTTNPPQSPVAWVGFATGKNPGKNGIFDFIVRDPQTYALNLSLSRMKNGRPQRVSRAKGFWQYTSDKRVPTIIITCPVTYPPDKIDGAMLSGMGVPDILGTEGTFTFYTSENLDTNKEMGGKIFHVRKSSVMLMDLIGPRVAGLKGEAEQVKVPFKAVSKDKDSVIIEYQKNKTELKTGCWSGWQEVVFDLGFLKKAKGIFKFYLVEASPEFKLYISPINFDPRDPLFQISYPKNYSKDLAGAIGLYYTQGMPMDTWAVNEGRLSEETFLQQAEEVSREKKAMLDLELGRFEKGVLFCYFESVDIIQHMFWRYLDPQHPLYEKDVSRDYQGKIQQWYKAMDDILGSVLQKMGKDDTLIVLSDHGFGTFRRAVHLNSWLRANGYLVLKNPYASSGAELLTDIDWSKTKAYAIGFGAIYINQKDRERYGIVNPGEETRLLKTQISAKIGKWIDDKYNQPVVKKVYEREEIFRGDYAKETPDLYVGFNKGYRASWQTALGAVPEELIEDNLKKWSGDHLFDHNLVPGVIFLNKAIAKENPSIYDLAPTILKIIGYKEEQIKNCDFDGEALF